MSRYIYLFIILVLLLLMSAERSRKNADKSLSELNQTGETSDPELLDRKAILASDIGLYYQSIHDQDQARVYSVKAIEFTKKRIEIEGDWNHQNLNDIGFLYRNLAAIDAISGNISAAKESFETAKKYLERQKNLVPLAEYQYSAAELYATGFAWAYHAKEYTLAELYIQKALRFSIKANSVEQLAELYRQYGGMFFQKGEFEKAILKTNMGIETQRNGAPNKQLPNVLISSKIKQHYKLKQYQHVIDFLSLEKGYQTPSETERLLKENNYDKAQEVLNNVFILSFAYIRSFNSTQDVEQLQKALEWQKLAYRLAEKAILNNGANKLGTVVSRPEQKIISTLKNYELLQQETEVSQEDLGQLMRILDTYHSTKLHLDRLNNDLNATVWQEQKQLKLQFDQLIEEQSALKTDSEKLIKIDSLTNLSYSLSLEIANLNTETKRDQLIEEYRQGQDNFLNKLNAFSKNSKKNIVSYFWAESLNTIYILGKSKHHYFFKALEAPDGFKQTIQRSYELNSQLNIKQDDIKEQNDINSLLYNLFILPIKKEIGSKGQLLIYPFGQISYVSFDALLQTNNRYLVEDYSLGYTSSLFSILRPNHKKKRTKGIASFYPKNYGTDTLTYLFHAKDEIQSLKEQGDCRSFDAQKATKSTFIKEARRSKILHVSSHSILNLEDPYKSYLIFDARSDSLNKLYAYEIFAESFNAELVTLSSCHSSSGSIESGIGMVSLSNAFYFSGIPSTVGSLWSAQDQSSSEIMIGFYNQLSEGKAKSESLTNAKRNYLKNADNIRRQPFFWANYVLYGSDDPIILKKKESSYLIWMIAGSGLLILTSFVIYKRSKRLRALS